jgi:hypothetical protein
MAGRPPRSAATPARSPPPPRRSPNGCMPAMVPARTVADPAARPPGPPLPVRACDRPGATVPAPLTRCPLLFFSSFVSVRGGTYGCHCHHLSLAHGHEQLQPYDTHISTSPPKRVRYTPTRRTSGVSGPYDTPPSDKDPFLTSCRGRTPSARWRPRAPRPSWPASPSGS